jgi:cytidylate kinase
VRRHPIVTIDGPAGAGKSTVARAVADRLGFVYLDTGAIYRAVALALTREPGLAERVLATVRPEDLSADDQAALGALASALDFAFSDGGTRAWLRGEDVSKAIRTQEIGQRASWVSAVPAVRAGVLDLQRRLAGDGGVVAEGRDLGTVVFPDAEVKFYLTADLESRAERRARELRGRGEEADSVEIRREIEVRDRRDSERTAAPLRRPEDAVLVDTSGLSVEDVVARLAAVVSGRQRS